MKKIQRYRLFWKHEEDLILKNKLREYYISNVSLQQTKVDIILPTFNRSDILANAIHSIRNQLHQKWRLYICDDGSTDSTFELSRRFENDSRIKLLQLAHKGVSSARNSSYFTRPVSYLS